MIRSFDRARRLLGLVLASALALLVGVSIDALPAHAAACVPTYGSASGKTTVTFPSGSSGCTWTVPAGITSLQVLVVGGGGAGASDRGGGGGGGAVVYIASQAVTPGTDLTVTVGAGGSGVTGPIYSGSSVHAQDGASGVASTLTWTGISISAGGGRGGYSPRQGWGSENAGGGGGTASVTGTTATTSATGASGGRGIQYSNGTWYYAVTGSQGTTIAAPLAGVYGSGGGGGGGDPIALGGTNAGQGYYGNSPGTNGIAGFGGGGGGVTTNPGDSVGGSGTVALAYSLPQTVTFDANGGTGSMANQASGVAANLTANAFSRPGYGFAGWSTTSGGSVAYANQASYPFTSSETLFAQWTAQSQTITYSANQGTGSAANTTGITASSVSLSGGGTIARSGYNLLGWDTSSSATSATYSLGQSITMPAGGLSLHAVWSGTAQSITYNANQGTGSVSSTTGSTGAAASLSSGSGMSRLGYSLVGWDTSSSATSATYSVGQSITMPDGGLTLFAVWAVASNSITYDANGGTGAETATTGNTGVSVNLASGTNLSGGTSTFLGWDTSSSATVPTYTAGHPLTMPAGGLTLYAIWDPPIAPPAPPAPATWTLGYDSNGGTCSTSSSKATDGTWLSTPGSGDCSRTGFVFTGWNTRPDGTGLGFVPGGQTQMTGDNSLYAQWEPVAQPSATPTVIPSAAPSASPSANPATSPTSDPTSAPSASPSSSGTSSAVVVPRQQGAVTPGGTHGSVDPLNAATPSDGATLDSGSVAIWDGSNWVQQYTESGAGSWAVVNGQVLFVPLPGFAGTSTSKVRVTDSAGKSGTAPVSFTVPKSPATSPSKQNGSGGSSVIPAPAPPALPSSQLLDGSAISGTAGIEGGTANVKDWVTPSPGAELDASSLVIWDGTSWVKSFTDPGVGAWRVIGSRIVFTPAPGYIGTARTTYRVTDTSGKIGQGPIDFTVTSMCPSKVFSQLVVSFSPLSAELPGGASKAIASMAKRGCSYLVTGYVQPVGTTGNDASLSKERAKAVASKMQMKRSQTTVRVATGQRLIQPACAPSENRCVIIRVMPR